VITHRPHITSNRKGDEDPYKVRCDCGWSMNATTWESTEHIVDSHIAATSLRFEGRL